MKPEVVHQLLEINREFYQRFAAQFDHTRRVTAYGFRDMLPWLPEGELDILDVGCGNGRYGYFMLEEGRVGRYVGVDSSTAYMGTAQAWAAELAAEGYPTDEKFRFVEADMMEAGFLDNVGNFDLVCCFSSMHHVPTRTRRVALLREMADHMKKDGRLLLGNWHFLSSERQRRKLLPWETVGLTADDVEPNDYLMKWQRGGLGHRYVCMIDEAETAALAAEASLDIVHQFRADGREGNLNLYTILK